MDGRMRKITINILKTKKIKNIAPTRPGKPEIITRNKMGIKRKKPPINIIPTYFVQFFLYQKYACLNCLKNGLFEPSP